MCCVGCLPPSSRDQRSSGGLCCAVSFLRARILTCVFLCCVRVHVQRCLGGRRLCRGNASFPLDVVCALGVNVLRMCTYVSGLEPKTTFFWLLRGGVVRGVCSVGCLPPSSRDQCSSGELWCAVSSLRARAPRGILTCVFCVCPCACTTMPRWTAPLQG